MMLAVSPMKNQHSFTSSIISGLLLIVDFLTKNQSNDKNVWSIHEAGVGN